MPFEKSEAIVLRSYNWSESSRTVLFFSRVFGKLALVDRGGRSLKSKRGRLTSFARLGVTFYNSEKDTRGYISGIDLLEAFSFEQDGSLGRLAYGSAACELLDLVLPDEEPQEALYDYFVAFLKSVEIVHKRSLPPLFLAFFLRLLSHLGYHPALSCCAGCGRQVVTSEAGPGPEEATEVVSFFPERGGIICGTCQAPGDYYIPLSAKRFAHLMALQKASLGEAAQVSILFKDSESLLGALTRFLAYQIGLKADLKSLEFLQQLKDTNLT